MSIDGGKGGGGGRGGEGVASAISILGFDPDYSILRCDASLHSIVS